MINETTVRECTTCKELKTVDAFYTHRRGSTCKECHRRYSREQYELKHADWHQRYLRRKHIILARAKDRRRADLALARSKDRAKYHANRERKLELRREAYENCKDLILAKNMRWRAKQSKRYMRLARVIKAYGISAAEYDAMMNRCKGVCEICGSPPNRGDSLAVDHNHVSGKVRGMLCDRCNMAIGLLNDDPDRIVKTAEYLRSRNV